MEDVDFLKEKEAVKQIMADCWNLVKGQCFEKMTYETWKPFIDASDALVPKYKEMGSRYVILYRSMFNDLLNFVMNMQDSAGNEAYWVPPKKDEKKEGKK